MDLKVVFVVVFLSALAITSTHAGIPKCCISIKKPTKEMFNVERWERQYSNGACDIDALVVYVKNRSKPYCINHTFEKTLIKMTAKKRQPHQKRRV
ncbi:C-C motif chemokine 27a [Anableps anableps]